MSPATTAWPYRRPSDAATSRSRQLAVSATRRSPWGSTAIPVGSSSSLRSAGPPSPPNPGAPVPATVTGMPTVTRTPKDSPLRPGSSSTRLPGPEAMKRSPVSSRARASGSGWAPDPPQGPPATVTMWPASTCRPKDIPDRALTHPAVAGIGDEQVARGVLGEAGGSVEPGRSGRNPAGPVAAPTDPGQGGRPGRGGRTGRRRRRCARSRGDHDRDTHADRDHQCPDPPPSGPAGHVGRGGAPGWLAPGGPSTGP
jgi:hypothetical protein